MSELKQVMTPEHTEVFNRLRQYYDTNALAVMMAPLYPEASRNNIWILENTQDKHPEVWAKDACQNPDFMELCTGKGGDAEV